MKIVKKMKGAISWHFYNDREINSVLEQIHEISKGNECIPVKTFTNLFKGDEGNTEGEFYIAISNSKSRLFIEGLENKITLFVNIEVLENLILGLQSFIDDKKIYKKEFMELIVSKKDFILVGFNQQAKKYMSTDNPNANKEKRGNTTIRTIKTDVK